MDNIILGFIAYVLTNTSLPLPNKKGSPDGVSLFNLYRLNYFTITTRLVLLMGKMF